MRYLTNTDWTTVVEEKKGGLPTERGVQKGYEYQALCVCIHVCVSTSGSLLSRAWQGRSCEADYELLWKKGNEPMPIDWYNSHTDTHIHKHVHVTCRLMQKYAHT